MVLGSAHSVSWSYGAGDDLLALQLASFSALSRAPDRCEFWDSNRTQQLGNAPERSLWTYGLGFRTVRSPSGTVS